MQWFLYFLMFLLLVAFVVNKYFYDQRRHAEEVVEEWMTLKLSRQNFMARNNFEPVTEIDCARYGFYAEDDENRGIIFPFTQVTGVIFGIEDILSVELELDGKTISRVSKSDLLGGALGGGLLAGKTGAVVGAFGAHSESSQTVRQISAKLRVDVDGGRVFRLGFLHLTPGQKEMSMSHPKAKSGIDEAELAVDRITRSMTKFHTSKSASTVPHPTSRAEQLQQLAKLHADGYLTEDEFEAEKKRLN